MSTKIWIGDKMYLVDEPVREYVERLEAQLHTANAENEDLCNTIDAVRQERADYLAGTLEGKLWDENKRLLRLFDKLRRATPPPDPNEPLTNATKYLFNEIKIITGQALNQSKTKESDQ